MELIWVTDRTGPLSGIGRAIAPTPKYGLRPSGALTGYRDVLLSDAVPGTWVPVSPVAAQAGTMLVAGQITLPAAETNTLEVALHRGINYHLLYATGLSPDTSEGRAVGLAAAIDVESGDEIVARMTSAAPPNNHWNGWAGLGTVDPE